MSAPTVLLCNCGHPQRKHTEDFGCDITACGCTRYRDGVPAAPAVRKDRATEPAPAPQPITTVEHHTPPSNGVHPAAAPTSAQVVPRAADDPRVLIAAAKRSTNKRLNTLGQKVEADLAHLLGLVLHDRDQAEAARLAHERAEEAKAEIARLEAQLAAAKAKLRGDRAPAAPSKPGDRVCPISTCGRDGLVNVGAHLRAAHGIVNKDAS